MKTILLSLVLLTGACAFVYAQSQHEMNRTAAEDFTKADAILNKVYKKVLASLEDAADKKQLIAAQRAWLAYRDAQATFQADLDARGGSMRPLIHSGTCTRLTEARTKELNETISER
jgi:uncharacterized protein YecT (DUF1311 family)